MENQDKNKYNIAFVDGQNLYFGTTKCDQCAKARGKELRDMKFSDCSCGQAWRVNLAKLRIYLAENYSVSEAYYFLGYLNDGNDEIYKEIQKAGFIVIFKEHNELLWRLQEINTLSYFERQVRQDIVLQ